MRDIFLQFTHTSTCTIDGRPGGVGHRNTVPLSVVSPYPEAFKVQSCFSNEVLRSEDLTNSAGSARITQLGLKAVQSGIDVLLQVKAQAREQTVVSGLPVRSCFTTGSSFPLSRVCTDQAATGPPAGDAAGR